MSSFSGFISDMVGTLHTAAPTTLSLSICSEKERTKTKSCPEFCGQRQNRATSVGKLTWQVAPPAINVINIMWYKIISNQIFFKKYKLMRDCSVHCFPRINMRFLLCNHQQKKMKPLLAQDTLGNKWAQSWRTSPALCDMRHPCADTEKDVLRNITHLFIPDEEQGHLPLSSPLPCHPSPRGTASCCWGCRLLSIVCARPGPHIAKGLHQDPHFVG